MGKPPQALEDEPVTRFRAFAAVAVALVAFGVSGSVAGAQDYPGTTASDVCTAAISASAPLLANTSVVVKIDCNALIDGELVHGGLSSTPVDLGTAKVNGHSVSFSVTLPGDWETNASHSATLRSVQTDALRASIKFYVNSSGAITAAPTTATSLARTGASSHTGDYVKSGVVLLAAGAVAMRLSRKRRHLNATA
jgi:hypothetical protein